MCWWGLCVSKFLFGTLLTEFWSSLTQLFHTTGNSCYSQGLGVVRPQPLSSNCNVSCLTRTQSFSLSYPHRNWSVRSSFALLREFSGNVRVGRVWEAVEETWRVPSTVPQVVMLLVLFSRCLLFSPKTDTIDQRLFFCDQFHPEWAFTVHHVRLDVWNISGWSISS